MRFGNLFREFTNSEKSGGLILLACTIASIWLANSFWSEAYINFWHTYIDLSFGLVDLRFSVQHWINDGLMTIFFLLVGLEIEREIYVGELNNIKAASLPVAGAIGGMIVPAGIYFLLTRGTSAQSGWGIPMATDIAFALGMLSLLGRRIPHSLKIFLTALAIIDDLGAIIIIAIFYNTGIEWTYLSIALGIFLILLVLNRLKINQLFFYLLPGIIMWYCMQKSGVHATLSGVLLAFAIPFGKHNEKNISYRLQHGLHKPVAFIVLPLFAMANTGIVLQNGWWQNLVSAGSTGIILGLLIGKPVGITLFSWLCVRFGWGRLANDLNWKYLTGAGILAGIGFTMSIFIANLAFTEAGIIQLAKVSILVASLLTSVIGLGFLYFAGRNKINLSD